MALPIVTVRHFKRYCSIKYSTSSYQNTSLCSLLAHLICKMWWNLENPWTSPRYSNCWRPFIFQLRRVFLSQGLYFGWTTIYGFNGTHENFWRVKEEKGSWHFENYWTLCPRPRSQYSFTTGQWYLWNDHWIQSPTFTSQNPLQGWHQVISLLLLQWNIR